MIFKIWLATVFTVWVTLVSIGPGFDFYREYWIYPLLMSIGSSVAGFTPEGGGAVAFPILNLYVKTSAQVARDFSLAIQCIGMVSASIYIVTTKGYNRDFYKPIPFYVFISMIGFVCANFIYPFVSVKIVQTTFIALAFAFIVSFWINKQYGTKETMDLDFRTALKMIVFCLYGGAAAAFFGTGSDMLVYVFLTTYYGLKEKLATDTSIIVMACVSVLGTIYKINTNDIQPKIYWMWLAAMPAAAIFGPLGNKLLKILDVEKMLFFVFILNGFNFIYFITNNSDYDLATTILAIFLLMIFIKTKRKNHERD